MSIVIRGAFALDLELEDEWVEYRKENGIENPWAKYRKAWNESVKREEGKIIINGAEINGTTISFTKKLGRMTPTDEERIAYRRLENLWKGARILPQVTWDEFERWVEVREGIELADFRPCDSRDGTCAFTCALFGEKCPFGK